MSGVPYRLAPGEAQRAPVEVVRVLAWDSCKDCPAIVYYGCPEAMIALGVATAKMLSRDPDRRQRSNRDADGDRFHLDTYYRGVGSDRGPQRFHRLIRWKPYERLERLPGAKEVLAPERDDVEHSADIPLNIQREVSDMLARFSR